MREIRTSGLMSGEGKRSDAHKAQATAPLLDSTEGPGSIDGKPDLWRSTMTLNWPLETAGRASPVDLWIT